MQYIKNTELAATYHVSLRTVLNWVNAAKKGRLDLALHVIKDKAYVANTSRNIAILKRLAEEGRKYRNARGYKLVNPAPEFYTLYAPEQIMDIVSNLEVRHEIPCQYTYFDKGAQYWDRYAQRLYTEETPNTLTSTVHLLNLNLALLDDALARYKKVNIVDIGPGNALPVKDLIGHLLNKKQLGTYIGVDISPEMLEIAHRNIYAWYAEKVPFEGELRDISFERISDVLSYHAFHEDGEDAANIVLFFGGTINNFRSQEDVLRTIYNSLGPNDLLLCSCKLDSPNARRYFDFNVDTATPQPLSFQDKFVINLLGIDESYYEAEAGFDPDSKMRFLKVRLTKAISVKFNLHGGEKLVHLNKGDAILLWRAWHVSSSEAIVRFEKAGFELLHAAVHEGEFLLSMHRVKVTGVK